MRTMWLVAAAAGVVATLVAGSASARPNYKDALAKAYSLKPESNVAKASCGACHNGPDKKIRNVYGQEIGKALGKPGGTDAEVTTAIKKVDPLKTADKKTTYGALIKADKLPAGGK